MKKNMFLLILITLLSCSNYKYIYAPTSQLEAEKLARGMENFLKKDEVLIAFTKSFENSKVKIIQNDSTFFDAVMHSENKYFAGAHKIAGNSDLQLIFEGIKKPLILTRGQMKNFKFIYFEKKDGKVFIEFNNGTKNFDGKYIMDSEGSIRNGR